MSDNRTPRTDGSGRQYCRLCPRRSIAGFGKGQGHCPYHWAVRAYGQAWADSIFLPEGTSGPQNSSATTPKL